MPDRELAVPTSLTQTWMSLDRMLAFRDAAEAGSPRLAAKGNKNKEQNIRRKIKELSIFLGRSLTESNGNDWNLTPAGDRFKTIVDEISASLKSFKAECDGTHQLSVGAGDRVMQWFFIPRLKHIRTTLHNYTLSLFNLKSEEVIHRVKTFTLDFGLIREQDRPRAREIGHLKMKYKFEYSLFVPRSPELDGKDAAFVLANCPLALVAKFSDEFEDRAREADLKVQLGLLCSTFPQARRAVTAGYAAILPTAAFSTPENEGVRNVQLPVALRSFQKNDAEFSLIWNKRLETLRRDFDKVRRAFSEGLGHD